MKLKQDFYFNKESEVFKKLPMFKSLLGSWINWKTDHYGINLFEKDIILRISKSNINGKDVFSLGYKEEDIDDEINIRKEFDEIITNERKNSYILNKLGLIYTIKNLKDLENMLENNGFNKFMSFSGESRLGYIEELDFKLKLMKCSTINFPYIFEIERESKTYEDIKKHKKNIMDFIGKYNLSDILLKDEPPMLLYKAIN